MAFIIKSKDEKRSYWNNENGWGDRKAATRFEDADVRLPFGGKWISAPLESVLVFGVKKGWLRLVRAETTKRKKFEFLVNQMSKFGYTLLCLDNREAAEGWGHEVPEEIETIEI